MTVPYTFANQTGTIPLSELDANFAAIPNFANTAATVTTNAQPNITSIGTLSSLSVTGNTVTNLIFQKAPIISLGANAGFSSTTDIIAIGNAAAGNNNQQAYGIAIGSQAGYNNQGGHAIAIGNYTGYTNQGANSIAIGRSAGNISQGGNSVAIGNLAGNNIQSTNAVAIGDHAGFNNQGDGAVAIGRYAGNNAQSANAIALGRNAANITQGLAAIAIGHGAGNLNQGSYAVALGAFAGNNNQGSNSVAIGSFAGYPVTANNAIVINGAATTLNAPNSGLYIAPIRSDNSNVTNTVYYNTTTKELTYSVIAGSDYGNANVANYLPIYSGNIFSLNSVCATGNITSDGYFLGNGSLLTGISASNIVGSYSNANVAAYLPTYTGNITAQNISTTGNITGNYFIGNGSQLTGIIPVNQIVNGNSNINIASPGNNIVVTVGNTQSATFFNTGVSLPGNVTTGNVNSGNIISSANINLKAVNLVNVTQSLFRLASFTTAQAANLTPQSGDMIFNNTLGNVQIYTGIKWGNVVVS
jgi:hypothetical protein